MTALGAVQSAALPVKSGVRFWWLFASILGLLVVVMLAAFTLPSPWSWLVGITYIAYESWLTGRLFANSRRAVLECGQKEHVIMEDKNGDILIAVLIAARNERSGLPATLAALHAQIMTGDEIIVIDDGSTDQTVAWFSEQFVVTWVDDIGHSATHPFMRMIRQANKGKARALNTALEKTSATVVMTLDADTVVAPGALAAVRQTFRNDPSIGAACGVLSPLCQHGWSSWFFGIFQHLEYCRSYLWRMGWTRENTLVLVSGAFAAFRHQTIMAVGGFDPSSKVEDYELLFRLNRAAAERGEIFRAVVMPTARAMTDVPGTVRQFLRQRARWFAGFIQTMIRHRDLVGDARCGRLGSVHLLIKTIDLLLPLYGLLAFVVLMVFLIAGGDIHPAIIGILIAKLTYDLGIHLWSMSVYRWWQGGSGVTIVTLIATFFEPLLFQPLRQLGAALGWLAYLTGRIDWSAQRPVGKSS